MRRQDVGVAHGEWQEWWRRMDVDDLITGERPQGGAAGGSYEGCVVGPRKIATGGTMLRVVDVMAYCAAAVGEVKC
ncbi:unnamed protein product [Pylaiella littoralis]